MNDKILYSILFCIRQLSIFGEPIKTIIENEVTKTIRAHERSPPKPGGVQVEDLNNLKNLKDFLLSQKSSNFV